MDWEDEFLPCLAGLRLLRRRPGRAGESNLAATYRTNEWSIGGIWDREFYRQAVTWPQGLSASH